MNGVIAAKAAPACDSPTPIIMLKDVGTGYCLLRVLQGAEWLDQDIQYAFGSGTALRRYSPLLPKCHAIEPTWAAS
jgi:hypothetical protein